MMLFPARSEAIHCSKNRMPKIRLPDNPITFQVFTSIIKKENVPNTDIFRYRIELLPSQKGGVKLCTELQGPIRRHADTPTRRHALPAYRLRMWIFRNTIRLCDRLIAIPSIPMMRIKKEVKSQKQGL